jgi:hypothetical protein
MAIVAACVAYATMAAVEVTFVSRLALAHQRETFQCEPQIVLARMLGQISKIFEGIQNIASSFGLSRCVARHARFVDFIIAIFIGDARFGRKPGWGIHLW